MRMHSLRFEWTRFSSGIVFALYLLLIATGAFQPIADTLEFSLRPLQRWGAGLSERFAGFLGRFQSASTFSAEIERLQEENVRLVVENAQLRSQMENSADIAQQLAFLKPRRLEAVLTQVIGKSPTPDHETLLLDRGTQDGVRKGAPLIVSDGVFIGMILSASAHTSVALLATDTDMRVAGFIQNPSRSPGAVVGERGLGMRMELVPRSDTLTEGEAVVTSGIDPLVPEGLVIGKIARVTTKPGDLFHSADIEQAPVPTRLRIAAVLTDPQE